MKKQINPTIKAHLIRGAFYLLLLVAVCAIPFALAQRNMSHGSVTKSRVGANRVVQPSQSRLPMSVTLSKVWQASRERAAKATAKVEQQSHAWLKSNAVPSTRFSNALGRVPQSTASHRRPAAPRGAAPAVKCGLLVGSGMTTGFLPNGWEPILAGNTVNYTFSNSQPAPNEFALFETHDPWGFTVIKDAITGAGHTYTEFAPADLNGFNFSDYSVIILNWDDTNAPDFLADYTAAIPALETYINAGGVVWITAAIQTCDSIPMPFGGTGTGCDFGSNDPVVDPASPMMVGMPNPIPGSAANHLSFTGLPAAAHIVVITDTTGFPALYDFRPGENCGGGPCTLQPWVIGGQLSAYSLNRFPCRATALSPMPWAALTPASAPRPTPLTV